MATQHSTACFLPVALLHSKDLAALRLSTSCATFAAALAWPRRTCHYCHSSPPSHHASHISCFPCMGSTGAHATAAWRTLRGETRRRQRPFLRLYLRRLQHRAAGSPSSSSTHLATEHAARQQRPLPTLWRAYAFTSLTLHMPSRGARVAGRQQAGAPQLPQPRLIARDSEHGARRGLLHTACC